MTKLLIATMDTFTKTGRIVSRGQPLTEDEIVEGDNNTNVIEAPSGVDGSAVVQVSAIAPTGPNPQNPQQIAPDVVQTAGGYEQAGARLVGEVTKPERERIEVVGIDPEDDTQAKVTEALDNASADRQNNDDDLVAGNVDDVTAGLADADDAALDRLEAAENDRERPRKGVLNAIEAERARRSEA